MTTWTREQIAQARGIRAKAHVDETLAARSYADVMAATREKMFKRMAQVGHSFAIELHPADVQFAEAEAEDRPFCIEVTAWWEPQVQEVEFRGGPRDGERLAIQRPGEPFRVVHAQDFNLADHRGDDPVVPVARNVVTYDLAGWHEQGRHWICEA